MSINGDRIKLNSKRRDWVKFFVRLAEAALSVVFVVSLAVPFVFPNHAGATIGTSNKLSYQGRLTDTSGNPYTGTYYVCFSIYDAATAGNKLWPAGTPTSNSVSVSNGVFNTAVGVSDALSFDFSSNDTVYLNVEVASSNGTCGSAPFEALTPRQRMDAVAYARLASDVYGTALRTSSTAAQIGAGTGQATPIWLNLDWKNTATTLGAACPSGSVSGSVWYNSSGTRALMCINNVVVAIDNPTEVTGFKEQSSGSTITNGVINFSGSNNITISQTGSTFQLSVPNDVQAFGISNIGNTSGTSGSGTGTIILAGGNNITLSQATAAGGRTITISGPTFSNSNNVSFGNNAGTITATATFAQSVQTQNLQNVTLGGNTQGVMANISSGTMTLAGGNNITLSQNGNAITIVGGAAGGAGSNTFGMSNLGNTAGTTGTINGSAIQYVFAGGNNVTLSQSINGVSGTVTVSAANEMPVGVSNLGNTFGSTGGMTGQIIFVGSNNISLSQSSAAGQLATVSIIGPSFVGGIGGGTSTASTGTIIFSNSNGVSFGMNGQTMTASVNSGSMLSRWEYPQDIFTSINTIGQGSLSVEHVYVPFNVTGTAMKIGGSLSAATNTSATTASANISLWMGIYTLNGSTLSLASSGSANNGFQWSQNASSTGNTSINSMRQMTVPINVNMTPGDYWVGAVISSATTYTSAAFTIYGGNGVANAATAAVLTPIGSNTTAARDVILFQGIYTAATSAGPTTILNAGINNTSASNVQRANFYNVIYNATY